MMKVDKAWVTLLTKESYLAGCLVLDYTLRKVESAYPLVVFATPDLPARARDVLRERGVHLRDIDFLEPAAEHRSQFPEHDHRFAETWTKLRCFELTEYERVVLLDSDMLVVRNMDELMTMDLEPGTIAAAHACTCNPRKLAHYPRDWVPENCGHTQAKLTEPLPKKRFSRPTHSALNSGTVVLRPSADDFAKIYHTLNFDPLVKTFKFPDQDLLAYVFEGKYEPISYRYNALKTLKSCHPEMWRDEDVKNVHYILDKPWASRTVSHASADTHQWWWNAYDELKMTWGDVPGLDYVSSTVAGDQ